MCFNEQTERECNAVFNLTL